MVLWGLCPLTIAHTVSALSKPLANPPAHFSTAKNSRLAGARATGYRGRELRRRRRSRRDRGR